MKFAAPENQIEILTQLASSVDGRSFRIIELFAPMQQNLQ
jgi:hypothetical protein